MISTAAALKNVHMPFQWFIDVIFRLYLFTISINILQ